MFILDGKQVALTITQTEKGLAIRLSEDVKLGTYILQIQSIEGEDLTYKMVNK